MTATMTATTDLLVTTTQLMEDAMSTHKRLANWHAAQPDPDTLVISKAEFARRVEAAASTERILNALRSAPDLARKPMARLPSQRDELARLRSIDADLERDLAALPTVDLNDRRAREHADRIADALVESRRVLRDGGHQLPAPLQARLTHQCETCNHVELRWSGPMRLVEAEVAQLETRIENVCATIVNAIRAADAMMAANGATTQ